MCFPGTESRMVRDRLSAPSLISATASVPRWVHSSSVASRSWALP
jgi:hypothetical protein